MNKQPEITGIINLDDYPINVATADSTADPGYTDLVTRLSEELNQQQYCVLPDFIRSRALVTTVDQVLGSLASGYRNTSTRNCYLQRESDPSLPSHHPANLFFDASYTMLAADVLPEHFALKTLYAWPPMIRFVCDITGSAQLYVSEDTFQPVNVLCSASGDRSAWHFDSWNAFTMTLSLQAADSGGDFQLVPNIRSKDNPNHQALAEVLQGDHHNVVTVSRDPGSLVIFRGSTSVHRVTEVRGDTMRLMGVFVYENGPGVIGDAQVNQTVYGPRAAGLQ